MIAKVRGGGTSGELTGEEGRLAVASGRSRRQRKQSEKG